MDHARLGLLGVTLALAAGGCAAAPLDGGGDGATPTTGIYQLTESRSGSCQPRLADDTIEAYVIAKKPGAMVLSQSGLWFGPPGLGMSWITLPLTDGALTLDLDHCGAALHQVLTIEQASASHVRARRVDSFVGVAGAAAGGCPASALPAADCEQTTELDYILAEPCPDSCIQSSSEIPDPAHPSVSLSCDC